MNPITILGLIAATLTTISQIPQFLKSFKTKSTKDVSLMMFTLLDIGVFLWLIYGILIKNLPVILANAVTFLLVSSIVILKLKYK